MPAVYEHILTQKKSARKLMSLLIDPDKTTLGECSTLAKSGTEAGVDFFFVGSSILTHGNLDQCVEILKKESAIPVILFPGNIQQVSLRADAILFISLISGRNPDLLIGNHVLTAPFLKQSGIEIMPTGYVLIDSGSPTSVSYMSNTTPIPHDKDEIAWCTALAGEMLGLKLIFLDAGSGARFPVSTKMIRCVRDVLQTPLIVGGGIRTPEKAIEACCAGADMVVVGNAIEKNHALISEMSDAIHSLQIT